jgi:transposase-like protein
MKWSEEFCFPICQHDACYVITTRKNPLYECKKCDHQTTLTVNTIFEKTRTNLTVWFASIFLIAHDKRGVSATLAAKELEISYQTAWTMMQMILTREGLEKLELELEDLKIVKRKEVAARIKTAISYGDLKENSEYHSAKNDQSFMEGRIITLERMLNKS